MKEQQVKILEALKRSPHLARLKKMLLNQLVSLSQWKHLHPGENLLKQGFLNQNLYYLVSGQVIICVDGKRIYELDQPGDILGEVSALTGEPTIGSVSAVKPTDIIVINLKPLETSTVDGGLMHVIYRWVSLTLAEKLDTTSQKAKFHEEHNQILIQQKELLAKQAEEIQLSLESQKLFSKNLERSLIELEKTREQLRQQNLEQAAGYRRLEDLHDTNERVLSKLSILQNTHFITLQKQLQLISSSLDGETQQLAQQSIKELDTVQDLLKPVTFLYKTIQAFEMKKVLLAESNKKQQIVARMALRGTGMDLEVVSTLEEGQIKLQQQSYDLICCSADLLELTVFARSLYPGITSLLMTSASTPDYLESLKKYPFVCNIVTRNDQDRTFTLKNIITTVGKLMTSDLFGLEKYLSWGVDVQQKTVESSRNRESLIDQMESDLEKLGLRRPLISKCIMITEELLMNALYDAPVDSEGTPSTTT